MQEMQVWSLCWEDPLGKETATFSSILDWKILWIEEPDGLQSMDSQRLDTMEHTHIQNVRKLITQKLKDKTNFKMVKKFALAFLTVRYIIGQLGH